MVKAVGQLLESSHRGHSRLESAVATPDQQRDAAMAIVCRYQVENAVSVGIKGDDTIVTQPGFVVGWRRKARLLWGFSSSFARLTIQ